MTHTLEPKVIVRQELLVMPGYGTIGYMLQDDELKAFAVRLGFICDLRGLPKEPPRRQVALGKIFRVSYQATRKWLDAEGFPATKMCIRLAEWGGVSFDWLMTGKGEPPTDVRAARIDASGNRDFNAAVILSGIRKIPVLISGVSQLPSQLFDGDQLLAGVSGLCVEQFTDDPKAFAVLVDSDDMYPRYCQGEYALVEPSTPPEVEDHVVIRLSDGRVLLRRLASIRGAIRLSALNSPEILTVDPADVVWMYWSSAPIPAKKVTKQGGE